jgi:hypothetical protein
MEFLCDYQCITRLQFLRCEAKNTVFFSWLGGGGSFIVNVTWNYAVSTLNKMFTGTEKHTSVGFILA